MDNPMNTVSETYPIKKFTPVKAQYMCNPSRT